MDTQIAVSTLTETDPQFVELCKTLFGDLVDPELVNAALFTRGGTEIIKSMPGPSDVHVMGGLKPTGRRRERGVRKSAGGVLVPVNKHELHVDEILEEAYALPEGVSKDDDTVGLTWSGTISKATPKREVFGWASIVQIDGVPVTDRQGDEISPEELEKAAYSYVIKSRVGGSQHKRTEAGAFHASDMIESMVLTPEKISKMGLPDDTPVGWWVGYKVRDDETWEKIEKGEQTGFSIHGRGRRVPIPA